MKEEYLGFYSPSISEVNTSWDTGIIVFDANALLNLYRYSDSTRSDFLLVLNKLKDRLFMPYQVGYEYHTNRINIIESLQDSYTSFNSIVSDLFEKQVANQLSQFKRHPSINLDSFLMIQKEFIKKISNELDKQKKSHPDFTTEDEILNQLTELYKDRVGKSFTKEELQKIYSEGKERYEQLVPPGYKDLETKKKKGEQHLYGDLIIWKEMINHAKKEKKSIIFVTDDRKEDWWKIENGKTIRPREELIKEFYDLTGIRIIIYTVDSFLHFSKERKLVSAIKEKSIHEVKEVRKSNEELNLLYGNTFKAVLDSVSKNPLDDPININQYKKISDLLPHYTNSNLQDALKSYEAAASTITRLSNLQEVFKPYEATASTIARLSNLQEVFKPYEAAASTIMRLSNLQEVFKPYESVSKPDKLLKELNKEFINSPDISDGINMQANNSKNIKQKPKKTKK